MVRINTIIKTLLMTAFIVLPSLSFAQSDNLSAFVDRTDVSVNDVIILTVRVGAILGTSRPSLNGLNRDFDQLGTTTSSSYSNVNGNVQSWTEYRVSLKPKSIGTFTIPSFRVGSETTQPITINVGEATQVSGTSESEIFLVAEVDKDTAYVQEQLIFTIKLYYSLRFDQGAQLSTPQVQDAVIQQLGGDESYQEIVNGIRYEVTERKYVIFPQSSGEMVIPPIYFTASVGGRSGLSRLLSRSTPVRQVNLASDAHYIEVKGIPDSFTGTTWLPASSLSIDEAWSGDASNLTVGDSITRNLTMVTTGLSSSLLPSLQYEEVDGLRFYPDQPTREDTANNYGVIGSRSEGTAIVASREGTFTLPEMNIEWWNTQTDSLELARIPSRTLEVAGATGNQLVTNQPVLSGVPATTGTGTQPTIVTETNPVNTVLITSTVLFAVAWLLSTWFWFRSRQLLAQGQGTLIHHLPEQAVEADEKLPNLSTSFSYFQQSCKQNELSTIRKAVLSWGQAYFQTRHIRTLDQLRSRCQSEKISELLFSLERALYGNTQDQSEFNANNLLKEITVLHETRNQTKSGKGKKEKLPPLYKN